MFTLHLPSAGVQIQFENGWRVTPTRDGADGVSFMPGQYSNEQLAKFITFFPSMWASVMAQESQVNPLLLKDAPNPTTFEMPEGFHWDLSGEHIPSARPFGLEFSYDDGESSWDSESMLALFHMLADHASSGRDTWVFGAINHNFRKRRLFFLQATKTGHCVVYDFDSKAWDEYSGEPYGEPTVSTVGVTSYITEGNTAPDESELHIGVDLLVRVVGVDYPTDLIVDVPERVFLSVEYNTPVEKALPLITNPNRLFYFLNTEHEVEKVVEDEALPTKRDVPPKVTWYPYAESGTPLDTGGSFSLEGEGGTFELYDVVRWLDECLDSYSEYAATFDSSALSAKALNEFMEKFSRTRVDVTPSKMDNHLPIQLEIAPSTYAWDGVRWFVLLGSQKINPEEYNGFRFIHKTVDVSIAEFTVLLQSCINTFIGAEPGLAALYYNSADLPEDDDAEGSILIVDPRTMCGVQYLDGGWQSLDPAPQYPSDNVQTNTGLVISCEGVGVIPSKALAYLVCRGCQYAIDLISRRYEKRDELCAETAFGTYELLHQCMPQAMLLMQPQVNTGVVKDIDTPLVLYHDKQRISHTTSGWYYNNVAHDRTKKYGEVGKFKVAYEKGSMPWGDSVATLLKDVLELVVDYDSPEVAAAIEIEHAQ